MDYIVFIRFILLYIVCARKTRVIDVVYNSSNNELVRTKTLVKGAIIQVDATPFRTWWEQHYGVKMTGRKGKKDGEEVAKKSNHIERKHNLRSKTRVVDPALEDQLVAGKVFACISSRPGQSGRCDGYILEGKELEFYARKLKNKKGGK